MIAGSSVHATVVRCSVMWNLLPPQLTSRLFDSSRSQWMVSPRVIRAAPTRTWKPPPVKRPRPVLEQGPSGTLTVTEVDWPPATPSSQVPTANAVTVTEPPPGTVWEFEKEYEGAAYAPW